MAKKSEQDPIGNDVPEDGGRAEPLPPAEKADDGDKTAVEAPSLDDTQPTHSTQPIARVPPKPGEEAPTARPKAGRVIVRITGWIIAVGFGLMLGVVGFALLQAAYLSLVEPIEAANAEIAALQARIAELEAEQEALQEAQAEMARDYAAALDDLAQEQAERADELESALTEGEERLAEAEAMREELAERLRVQGNMIEELQGALTRQRDALGRLGGQVEHLQEELPGRDELRALDRRLMLIRAWQEVLKARLQLIQNNPRGALDDLTLAETTLRTVYGLSTPDEQAALDPILSRLALALDEIYSNPYAATQDVEIIWHDLDALINPVVGPETLLPPTIEVTIIPLTPVPVTPATPRPAVPSPATASPTPTPTPMPP